MTWKGVLRVGVVGLVLLGGFGCVKKLPIPEHTNFEPINVEFGETLDSVMFEGVVATIPRGTLITSYHSGFNGGRECWPGGHVFWSGWKAFLKDGSDSLENSFYETLKASGYNVVGDPSNLFNRDKDLASARYRIAGRILDVKKNVCKFLNWSARFTGRDSGEAYVKIEWSLYSNALKETIMKHITTGHYKDDTGMFDGEAQLFLGAFSNSLENLAATQEFYNILARKADNVKVGRAGPMGDRIVIPKLELSRDEFSMHAGDVVDAVVTFPHGRSWGSGFIISKNGYILTNAHVVGELKDVPVNFGNGLELMGKVIKSDVIHDVALVKVDLNRAKAIPVKLEYPKVGTTVYAIGAPQEREFEKTITKGIVSKVVYSASHQLNVIQSDVSIHGGNSGGPLLDKDGNVIGICSYGYMPETNRKVGIGINFFLTIEDSLKALNIEIGEKP